MLTGQAKTDYQREYMRRRRAGLTDELENAYTNELVGSNKNGSNIKDKLGAVGLTIEGNKVGLNIPPARGLTEQDYKILDNLPPNCPDGRCRETDADGNPIYNY